jgi:predicted nucleic acid-binding protein
MNYVIDASAWLRVVLLEQQDQPDVLLALREAKDGLAILRVPEIFVAEVAHVVQRRRRAGSLTGAEADALVGWTLELDVSLCPLKPLVDPAMRLAWQHRLSVYDAFYLALATACGARLLTADDDLARAARLEGCT